MNKFVKKVMKYQENHSELLFEEIVNELKQLIKYHLKDVPKEYSEDLYQEMLMAIFDVINKNFHINEEISINKNLFTKENLKLLEDNQFTNANIIFENKYMREFINKYGLEILRNAFDSHKYKEILIYEFMLFCNERQLINYLNKSMYNTKVDYNKQIKKYTISSLNQKTFEGIELLELIEDKVPDDNIEIFNKYNLTEDEIDFLFSFICKGKLLTEKEVALKYNVSQQSISKKLKKIINKYKKNKKV